MFEYMLLAVARVLIYHSLMADCYSHHLSSLHLPYLVITHIDRQYQGSDNVQPFRKKTECLDICSSALSGSLQCSQDFLAGGERAD